MIKPIDTHYLLDELNLHAEIIRKLAKYAGFPRQSLSTADGNHTYLSAAVVGAEESVHLDAMLAEMDDRQRTRASVANGSRLSREVIDYTSFAGFTEMLGTLSKLPDPETIRVIMISHLIEVEAKNRGIYNKLIHTAVVHPTGSFQQPLSFEEQEKYAAFLPPVVAEEWKAFMATTSDVVRAWDVDTLVKTYRLYLLYVLDSYAVGTYGLEGSNEIAGYNTMMPPGEWKDRYLPSYNDDFWFRRVDITLKPGASITDTWHGPKNRLDDQDDAPYRVSIVFMPVALRGLDIVVGCTKDLAFFKTTLDRGEHPAHGLNAPVFYEVRKVGELFFGTVTDPIRPGLFYAAYPDKRMIGIGHTMLEAQADLAMMLSGRKVQYKPQDTSKWTTGTVEKDGKCVVEKAVPLYAVSEPVEVIKSEEGTFTPIDMRYSFVKAGEVVNGIYQDENGKVAVSIGGVKHITMPHPESDWARAWIVLCSMLRELSGDRFEEVRRVMHVITEERRAREEERREIGFSNEYLGRFVHHAIYLDGQEIGYVKDFSTKEGWVDVFLPIARPTNTPEGMVDGPACVMANGKPRYARLHGEVTAGRRTR